MKTDKQKVREYQWKELIGESMQELAQLVDEAEAIAIELGYNPDERSSNMSTEDDDDFQHQFLRTHEYEAEAYQNSVDLDDQVKELIEEKGCSYSEALQRLRELNPDLVNTVFPAKPL